MPFRKMLVLMLSALLMLGSGTAIAEQLRVGVEGAYPPFSWKEADGTLNGFDIEFAQAVCAHLG